MAHCKNGAFANGWCLGLLCVTLLDASFACLHRSSSPEAQAQIYTATKVGMEFFWTFFFSASHMCSMPHCNTATLQSLHLNLLDGESDKWRGWVGGGRDGWRG